MQWNLEWLLSTEFFRHLGFESLGNDQAADDHLSARSRKTITNLHNIIVLSCVSASVVYFCIFCAFCIFLFLVNQPQQGGAVFVIFIISDSKKCAYYAYTLWHLMVSELAVESFYSSRWERREASSQSKASFYSNLRGFQQLYISVTSKIWVTFYGRVFFIQWSMCAMNRPSRIRRGPAMILLNGYFFSIG